MDRDYPVRVKAGDSAVTIDRGEPGARGIEAKADPVLAVSTLYAEHALGLTRLALIMTGDRPAAEDIVQDAFCGLHRRWDKLRDPAKALSYVRSAVLNGCRTEFRRAKTVLGSVAADGAEYEAHLPPAWSAESAALATEERREVLRALLKLPPRQREALLLRYYLELSEAEAASAMRISRGTAKSTVARGLAALRKLLGEES
jgi:RNA polymerase sigma-70 factor (sigma-E family)